MEQKMMVDSVKETVAASRYRRNDSTIISTNGRIRIVASNAKEGKICMFVGSNGIGMAGPVAMRESQNFTS